MFNQNGLSLDQAPPISVIFRFFFAGTLWGIFAAVLLFVYKENVFNPSSTEAVIFTHTLTLGVMLSFMFAALFQMLPVIAGVTLTSPIRKANWIQYPMIAGTLMLLAAFHSQKGWLYLSASLILGVTLLSIVFIMLHSLVRLQNHSASSKGMMTALLSLGILVLLALYLTGSLGGVLESSYYLQVKKAHYSFGLFGWISLLIIAISFQVIEMFYVTPPYPDYMRRYLPIIIVLTLSADFLSTLFLPWISIFFRFILILELTGYAAITLLRLSQRKRPISDATVWFWRLGTVSLLISMAGMFGSYFWENEEVTRMSIIFFVSFALSIVFGMFYKIIPFLTWFHLNSQGYFSAPMMHEVIHPKTAKKHFLIHTVTLSTALLSLLSTKFVYLTAIFLMLSFGWMCYQIIHAHLLYKKTQREGEKFDFQME